MSIIKNKIKTESSHNEARLSDLPQMDNHFLKSVVISRCESGGGLRPFLTFKRSFQVHLMVHRQVCLIALD